MAEHLQVVDAIPDDVYDIRHVQKLTWLDTYPNAEAGISVEDVESQFANDDTPEGQQRTEDRKKRFFNDSRHTWVAKDNNKIVGFCAAAKEENNGRVQAIYLLPNYQGRGLGRQLMAAALNWLNKDQDIYINVASYNDKAIKFYEKFGFVKTGKSVSDVVAALPSGKTIPETEMLKKAV